VALGSFGWALLGSAQTVAGGEQEKRFTLFPAPGFDSGKIVSRGLKVTREGGSLVFDQEPKEAWPQAQLPIAVRLAEGSRLAVAAENLGKELLKIRFAAPGIVMPTERDALMALPHLELKPGEKGEIALPVKSILPLHQAVVKRLSEAGVVNADTGTAELTVFVYQTGQPRTFRISRIEAVGEPYALPEYGGWDADRFFPFVDRFGQFKHAEWPGKTRSEAGLKKALEQERLDLAARPGPAEWNAYGGWAKGPKLNATGRFRVEKVEGKWWFVDPEGCLWWSLGAGGVTSEGAGTSLDGRAFFFEGEPGSAAAQAPFVRTAGGLRAYDFRAANTSAKYGAEWKKRHSEQAHARLRGWALNTLGPDSAAEIKALRRTPYMERIILSAPRVEGVGEEESPLIDPYEPDFKKELERQLAACKALAADPWCVGIGVDSGIGTAKLLGLGRRLLAAPARQAAKRRLVDSLKRRHGKIETLNLAWKSAYADWEALLASTNLPPVAASRDCSEFAEAFAEATFKGIAAAFKAVAPDTLNLGCLMREPEPALLRLAGWNADVVSVAREGLSPEAFEVSPYLERPVLLVAFRQHGEERALPDLPGGAEAGRKASWRKAYVAGLEAALKQPNVVGAPMVRYAAGGPASGAVPDGLVDVCDTPDPELTARLRDLGAGLYALRSGYRLNATVRVDASKPLGARRAIERYINNSILMRSPPPELAEVIAKEYGRAKLVRCWVCLDDVWDIKTGATNFNYPIKNRVKGDDADFEMPDIPFETYLSAYAEISDEVLLNVRRLERHVVEGRMTMAQWKEVCKAAIRRYKTLCPKLRYIEALNEFHLSAFGDLNTKEYYEFYRTFYQIVNELNAELKPELPLLVGGPATTGAPPDRHLREFVALYAADPSPAKRLDFLSYHYYADRKWSEAAEFETRMTELLDAHQIPSDIPMFWDEMGFTGSPWTLRPVARELNRLQATCVTAFQYYSRKNRKLHVLPWVTFHSPSQTALTQFIYRPDGTLQMTPFGMTVKCWGMQKRNEAQTESTGLREDGSGLGAMGSVDESGAAVLLWNHQALPSEVDLAVTGLPEPLRQKGWRIRRYLVDSLHSNCYADLAKETTLAPVEETGGSGQGLARRFVMEPYAVSLLLIEKP
jgi:hypothetical protein